MTALFAFQLWIVGSGMPCIMRNAAMTGDMGRAASGAMMKGGHGPMISFAAAPARIADTPHQMPCDQQRNAPMCQAMGPCLTALAAAPINVSARSCRTPSLAIAMVVLAPPLPTFPPELPPPRA